MNRPTLPRAVRWAGTIAACSFVLTATACAPDAAAPASQPTGPASSVRRCDRGPAEGWTSGRRHITVDGTDRTFLLRAPAPDGSGPAPLIIGLHGFGSSAAAFEARTRLAERGSEMGSYVAVPDALGDPARWNFDHRPTGPDDDAFIDALVRRLGAEGCIDRDRVFVAGSSNGAAFAGLLACARPGRFAAVAMVIATVPTACSDEPTPSVLTIRGTDDQHVPFHGVRELIASDAEHAGCRTGPTLQQLTSNVERTRYAACRDGAEIVLDAVRGGTHQWPVASGPSDYDATTEVLAFFDRGRSIGPR